MARPKGGAAYQVFSCRFPPGLSARLTAKVRMQHQTVRDVVVQLVQAYVDDRQMTPLEQRSEQMVREGQQHIVKGLKMIDTAVKASRRTASRPPAASVAPQSDTNGVDVTLQPDGTPAYDTTKFKLGKLCPGEHEWGSTGKTKLTLEGSKCLLCEKERRARLRQAKHQALEASSA